MRTVMHTLVKSLHIKLIETTKASCHRLVADPAETAGLHFPAQLQSFCHGLRLLE